MDTNAPTPPPAPSAPSEPLDAGLLLEWEAALFLFGTEDLSRGTARLRNWRSQKVGPPYLLLGGLVRYRRSDLVAWLDSRVIAPARETAVRPRTRRKADAPASTPKARKAPKAAKLAKVAK